MVGRDQRFRVLFRPLRLNNTLRAVPLFVQDRQTEPLAERLTVARVHQHDPVICGLGDFQNSLHFLPHRLYAVLVEAWEQVCEFLQGRNREI